MHPQTDSHRVNVSLPVELLGEDLRNCPSRFSPEQASAKGCSEVLSAVSIPCAGAQPDPLKVRETAPRQAPRKPGVGTAFHHGTHLPFSRLGFLAQFPSPRPSPKLVILSSKRRPFVPFSSSQPLTCAASDSRFKLRGRVVCLVSRSKGC